MWCLDTLISIPFGPALYDIHKSERIERILYMCDVRGWPTLTAKKAALPIMKRCLDSHECMHAHVASTLHVSMAMHVRTCVRVLAHRADSKAFPL